MIWALLLAHFLGDFPLQPDWMVRRKGNLWVLSLHVSVHFVLMVLLVGQNRNLIWSNLLLLALVHLVQDHLKIVLTDRWPGSTVPLFFLDQLLHYLAIWGFVVWIQTLSQDISLPWSPTWAIISIAYLVVTNIWYISERVIHHADREYLKIIDETKLGRMLARSGFISIFFLFRGWALPNFGLLLSWPYPRSKYRKRSVYSDLSISLIVIIFLLATLGLD